MIFGGQFDTAKAQDFWEDNVGITPLVLDESDDSRFAFDLHIESSALPEDHLALYFVPGWNFFSIPVVTDLTGAEEQTCAIAVWAETTPGRRRTNHPRSERKDTSRSEGRSKGRSKGRSEGRSEGRGEQPMQAAQLSAPLRGVVPPMVTPLTDRDTSDCDGLARLIDHILAGGVHGLFLLGTDGWICLDRKPGYRKALCGLSL
jgi:hypothetical protein